MTISIGRPSVGGSPASSHTFIWTCSSPGDGMLPAKVERATTCALALLASVAPVQLWNVTSDGRHTILWVLASVAGGLNRYTLAGSVYGWRVYRPLRTVGCLNVANSMSSSR